jgi:hypothetical protein
MDNDISHGIQRVDAGGRERLVYVFTFFEKRETIGFPDSSQMIEPALRT